MTAAVRSLGVFVSLACLAFFLVALQQSWDSLGSIQWDRALLASGALALSFYLVTYAVVIRCWQLVMCALGSPISYATATRILLLSQFGKYAPGNIGQHLGRVWLARRAGLATQTVLTSIIIETVTLVLAAGVCSLAAAHLLPELFARYGEGAARTTLLLLTAGTIALAAAISIPNLRRRLLSALAQTAALLTRKNRSLGLQIFLLHALNFVLGALSLRSLAGALGNDLPLVPLVGIYAMAWLCGFIVPGAPAGLGVREAVLLVGLTPLLSSEATLATAAGLRMVNTLGDVVAVLIGFALRGRADAPAMDGARATTSCD